MTTQTLAPLSFHSGTLEPGERFDAWQSAISSAFVPLDADTAEPADFNGHLRAQPLGLVTLNEVGGQAVHVKRNRQSIAASNPGVYKFALQRSGTCLVRQDEQEALLTPGDLVVYDTTRPYDVIAQEPYSIFVVQVPHEHLGISHDQARRLVAQRISGSTGLGALTSSLLTTLSTQLETEEMAPDPRAAAAVLQMVQATLLARLGPTQKVPARDVVYLEAVRHIDRHLGDPQLSVSTVAQALHVSVRYLQVIFADEGTTVSDWIRHRRLEHCRVELSDPSQVYRPVSAIAARWGYADASSFTRSFKAAFGVPPTQYRRQTLVQSPTAA